MWMKSVPGAVATGSPHNILDSCDLRDPVATASGTDPLGF